MTTFSDALAGIGRYVLLMGRVLTRPDRWRMFFRQYVTEMFQLGYNSIGIVLIISFFIGAVICLQIKLVLLIHHVSDIGRQSRVEHCIRIGYDAHHPTD